MFQVSRLLSVQTTQIHLLIHLSVLVSLQMEILGPLPFQTSRGLLHLQILIPRTSLLPSPQMMPHSPFLQSPSPDLFRSPHSPPLHSLPTRLVPCTDL